MCKQRTIVVLVSVLVLSLGVSGCGLLSSQVPILSPPASAGLGDGLAALKTYLTSAGDSPDVIAAVTDAQAALAADTTGTTWGALVRTLLDTLWTNASTQSTSFVAKALSGLEAILATIGA